MRIVDTNKIEFERGEALELQEALEEYIDLCRHISDDDPTVRLNNLLKEMRQGM